jgi:hypothetical protein
MGDVVSSVIFVHGTSVRYPAYAGSFATFRDHVLRLRPATQILPCAWGDVLGSPPLDDLSLIPAIGRSEWMGKSQTVEDRAEYASARRMVLDLDPLHELTQLELLWRERSKEQRPLLKIDTAEARYRALLPTVSANYELQILLDEVGIADGFIQALASVAESELVRRCVDGIRNATGPDWGIFADYLAEAIIAEAFRVTQPASPRQYSAESRNALADRIVGLFQGRQLGLREFATALGRGTLAAAGHSAAAAGGKMVQHWRGPFSSAIQPFVGDIFRYLAFGEPLRQFIANQVLSARPPVILVGHSLGGIACLDLLAMEPGLPVAHLVTIGSQGSQLYRMGALPGLPDEQMLPVGFPRWTNIYSRHDLLSYLSRPVFGDQNVTDVEIPGAQVMPAAHSDYFNRPALYELLASFLDAGYEPVTLGAQ